MKKKLLAILICGAMSASVLSGCGGSSGESENTPTADTETVAEDQAEIAPVEPVKEEAPDAGVNEMVDQVLKEE